MISLLLFDIILLVAFTLATVVFVKTRKHNLKKEGFLYLYKTSLGIKFIDNVAKKYEKILKPLQYLIVFVGYILMVSMIWLMIKTIYIYLTNSEIVEQIKAPPVVPLLPYFPQLFGLEDFFPNFYFMHFIIAIAIVAIVHEFSHGIFARLNNIKIHSTGFAFFGPILGAFVEQDEKQMNKAKKFPQLAILAAGVFANLVVCLIFMVLLIGFVSWAFVPQGVFFNSYATSVVNLSESHFEKLTDENKLIELTYKNQTYFTNTLSLKKSIEKDISLIQVFDNSPAFKAKLSGAIVEIDGKKIKSSEDVSNAIRSHSPYEEIEIKTIDGNKEIQEYKINLSERNGNAFLGIGFNPSAKKSLVLKFAYILFVGPEGENIYYESRLGEFGIFFRDLLWWIVMINFLVALFNMLPVGILDGGRFFYLTIWGITGNKKIAEKTFAASTWLILLGVILLMIRWMISLF